MILRPYQQDAIDGARIELRNGAESVLLIAATGAGKTVVASAIIANAEQLGTRTLFLAHRRELIEQTSQKLQAFGVRHGIIMPGYPVRTYERVQVASVQTLAARPDLELDFELIFIDEAHHASAGTYQKVLRMFPRAKLIGLTATPWRLDGKGLGDIFQSHVIAATPAQLFQQGYLCPLSCWTYRPIDTRGVSVTGGDFNGGALAEKAMDRTVVGDVVREYATHCRGRRALLFAVTIAHSQAMAQAFRAQGIAAEHVDGEMGTDERSAVLERLREGRTHVVCNVNICTEGYDLPSLEAVLLCRPTLSESLYLQMVGRGARTFEGKENCRIHDHARLCPPDVFGHPYDERDFSPKRTAKKTRKDVEQSRMTVGGEVTTREVRQLREAEATEVVMGGNRGATDARPPPKVWFSKWTVDERRQWFFKQVQANGIKKAKSNYRWASGEREWPPHEWVRLAERTMVPRTGAA